MTAIQNVLIPTDFSTTSDAALRHAVTMARTFGARLYVLHVPGRTGENFEANFPIGQFERLAPEKLALLLSPEEIAQLKPEYALRIGAPADEIVQYAKTRDVDLIVMGTHGRSGVAHLLLGSVAEHVVRMAPCPVLLVRSLKSGSAKFSERPSIDATPLLSENSTNVV
jgi:nucleotide-binding universal stress UspA family protein